MLSFHRDGLLTESELWNSDADQDFSNGLMWSPMTNTFLEKELRCSDICTWSYFKRKAETGLTRLRHAVLSGIYYYWPSFTMLLLQGVPALRLRDQSVGFVLHIYTDGHWTVSAFPEVFETIFLMFLLDIQVGFLFPARFSVCTAILSTPMNIFKCSYPMALELY